MPRRQAAGRDRGARWPASSTERRCDARAKRAAALGQFDEERRVGRADQIGAQAVADDDDDARPLPARRHGATPFSSATRSARSRRYRNCAAAGDCARARYSALSGCDSRNGTVCSPRAAMRAQPVAGERRQIVLGRGRADHRVAVAGDDEVGLAVVGQLVSARRPRRGSAPRRCRAAPRTARASAATGDAVLAIDPDKRAERAVMAHERVGDRADHPHRAGAELARSANLRGRSRAALPSGSALSFMP